MVVLLLLLLKVAAGGFLAAGVPVSCRGLLLLLLLTGVRGWAAPVRCISALSAQGPLLGRLSAAATAAVVMLLVLKLLCSGLQQVCRQKVRVLPVRVKGQQQGCVQQRGQVVQAQLSLAVRPIGPKMLCCVLPAAAAAAAVG
jgi:hypothetical protein